MDKKEKKNNTNDPSLFHGKEFHGLRSYLAGKIALSKLQKYFYDYAPLLLEEFCSITKDGTEVGQDYSSTNKNKISEVAGAIVVGLGHHLDSRILFLSRIGNMVLDAFNEPSKAYKNELIDALRKKMNGQFNDYFTVIWASASVGPFTIETPHLGPEGFARGVNDFIAKELSLSSGNTGTASTGVLCFDFITDFSSDLPALIYENNFDKPNIQVALPLRREKIGK